MLLRSRRTLLFALSVAIVVVLQWAILSGKVLELRPDQYSEYAEDVAIRDEWRYGLVQGYHGATLVKTRNVSGSAPKGEPTLKTKVNERLVRQLEYFPTKAAIEAAFYLTILAYCFFGARRLSRALGERWPGRFVALASAALSWMLVWTAIAAPALWAGYGDPLDTHVGLTGLRAPAFWSTGTRLTVSYGGVVMFPTFPAVVVAESIQPAADYLAPMRADMFLWLAGLLFYGALGILIRMVRILSQDR